MATLTSTASPSAVRGIGSNGRYQICLLHPFDPRGRKVGGLETYLRDFITFHPADTDILFIGVDSIGDLEPGSIHRITFRGRNFDFMPILHYTDEQAREASRTIRGSLTGQFFGAIVRHLRLIAREIRTRQCSVDLRRVEFSWLPALLRVPFVQMLHGEGVPKLKMDSLLKKYAFVHHTGERFAVARCEKFLCVNPHITERIRATYPAYRDKIDTLWTWVNTNIFEAQPFPETTAPFRVAFAGRLDEFKVPPLMFKTMARLKARLPGQVEFHYIGTSDPERFGEFAEIADITVRHGFKDAHGMAATFADMHAGILTSEFEGMPRCVLETLAVGRPVVAMHLPQLEAVIHESQSGFLVQRGVSIDHDADQLASRLLDVRDLINAGAIDPADVASCINDFTPHTQLARVFKLHKEIQNARNTTNLTAIQSASA